MFLSSNPTRRISSAALSVTWSLPASIRYVVCMCVCVHVAQQWLADWLIENNPNKAKLNDCMEECSVIPPPWLCHTGRVSLLHDADRLAFSLGFSQFAGMYVVSSLCTFARHRYASMLTRWNARSVRSSDLLSSWHCDLSFLCSMSSSVVALRRHVSCVIKSLSVSVSVSVRTHVAMFSISVVNVNNLHRIRETMLTDQFSVAVTRSGWST